MPSEKWLIAHKIMTKVINEEVFDKLEMTPEQFDKLIDIVEKILEEEDI